MVDWLEKNAKSNLKRYPEKINYFADVVTWENTLHSLQHGRNDGSMVTEMVRLFGQHGIKTTKICPLYATGLKTILSFLKLVSKELIYCLFVCLFIFKFLIFIYLLFFLQDPDAPARQGRNLVNMDARDEQSLIKHLFACVRAGEFVMAQELCVKCGQPWRAASLEGWKLSHDPNLGKSECL